MITAVAQAIRNHKTSAPCCYMPGTKEHTTYWETMQSIEQGDIDLPAIKPEQPEHGVLLHDEK